MQRNQLALLFTCVWHSTCGFTQLTLPPEGFINLTLANSPYQINENLTASNKTEIFLEAGVKLLVAPGVTVTVNGSFSSFGTQENPVVWDSLKGEDYLDNKFSTLIQFYEIDGEIQQENFAYLGLPICEISWNNYNGVRKSTKELFLSKAICAEMGYEAKAELLDPTTGDPTKVDGWSFYSCNLNSFSLEDCAKRSIQCQVGQLFRARCTGKLFHRNWGGLKFNSDLNKTLNLANMKVLNAGLDGRNATAAVTLPDDRNDDNLEGLIVDSSYGIGIKLQVEKLSKATVINCNQGGIEVKIPYGTALNVAKCKFENNRNFGLNVVNKGIADFPATQFCLSTAVNLTDSDPPIHYIYTKDDCTREFSVPEGVDFFFSFFPLSDYAYFTLSVRNSPDEPFRSLLNRDNNRKVQGRLDYRYVQIRLQPYINGYNHDLLIRAVPKHQEEGRIESTVFTGNEVGLLFSLDNSYLSTRLTETILEGNEVGLKQLGIGDLVMEKSTVKSNGVGVWGHFENVNVSGTTVMNCTTGVNITVGSSLNFIGSDIDSIIFDGCSIEDNKVGVVISGEQAVRQVKVTNTQGSGNKVLTFNVSIESDLVRFENSKFQNNIGGGVLMVNTINGVQHGGLEIVGCDFVNNSVHNVPHFQVNLGSNAVIKTNYHTNVTINRCRLTDLQSQYEVALTFPYFDKSTSMLPTAPFYEGKSLDLTENWWGTNVISSAALRVYDRNLHLTLESTRLSPYYDSGEMTNLQTSTEPFRFVRENEISGVVDKPIDLPAGEYHVVGDILVKSEGKLTLQPGVILTFPPTSALVIHGRLVSDADNSEMVEMRLRPNITVPTEPGYQILNDGTVYFATSLSETGFGTVCVDYQYGNELRIPVVQSLCRWGGFKETGNVARGHKASAAAPAKFSRLSCVSGVDSPAHCDLTPCGYEEESFCQTCELLAISCTKWTEADMWWEGVELSPVAPPSVIRNTKISGAGRESHLHPSPSALRIGFHRHEISNITIESDNPVVVSNISVSTPFSHLNLTPRSAVGQTGAQINRPFTIADFSQDPGAMLTSCMNNSVNSDDYKTLWLYKTDCNTIVAATNTNVKVLIIAGLLQAFRVQLYYEDGTPATEQTYWNSHNSFDIPKGQVLVIKPESTAAESFLQLIGSYKPESLESVELSFTDMTIGKFKMGISINNDNSNQYRMEQFDIQSSVYVTVSPYASPYPFSGSLSNSRLTGDAAGGSESVEKGVYVPFPRGSQISFDQVVISGFKIGIEIEDRGAVDTFSSVSIRDSSISSNQLGFTLVQSSCMSMNITFERVKFDNNERSVDLTHFDASRWSVQVYNCSFSKGNSYILTRNNMGNGCDRTETGSFLVSNTNFENNRLPPIGRPAYLPSGHEGLAIVSVESDVDVEIKDSRFEENNADLILNISCTASSNQLKMSRNLIADNNVKFSSVDISYCQLQMVGNIIKSNSLSSAQSNGLCAQPTLEKLSQLRFPCYRVNTTVNLRLSHYPTAFRGNVFDNKLRPELYAIFDIQPMETHWDGSLNYWGSDLGTQAAIILENGNVRPRTKLSPVYTTTEMNETVEGNIDEPFISPQANFSTLTGSFVADTTLSLSGSPYVFQQDVFIPENVTVKVEPDVKLLFAYRTGLVVDGNLIAEGTAEKPVIFDAAPMNISFSPSQRFQLTTDNFLQVSDQGSWHYVTPNFYSSYSHFEPTDICYFLNRSAAVSLQTVPVDRVKGAKDQSYYVSCNSFVTESDCNFGRMDSSYVQDLYVLTCGNQQFWEGIYLRSATDKTVLSHVEILNAGGTRQGEMGSALQSSGSASISHVTIRNSVGSGVFLKHVAHHNPLMPKVLANLTTANIVGVSLLWPMQYSANIKEMSVETSGLGGLIQLPVYHDFSLIRWASSARHDFTICQSDPVFVPPFGRRFKSQNRMDLWLPKRLRCQMRFETHKDFSLLFSTQSMFACDLQITDSLSNVSIPVTTNGYHSFNFYETYTSVITVSLWCTGERDPSHMFIESQPAVWHDRFEENNRLLIDLGSEWSIKQASTNNYDYNPQTASGHFLATQHYGNILDPIHRINSVDLDLSDICFATVAAGLHLNGCSPEKALMSVKAVLNGISIDLATDIDIRGAFRLFGSHKNASCGSNRTFAIPISNHF